jgi:hypothetical protein
LVNAVANWRGANVLERSDDRSLQAVAYVIRSDFANLLQLSFLVGGPTWTCQMAPLVRGCWKDQDLDSYSRQEPQGSRHAPQGERRAGPVPAGEAAGREALALEVPPRR